jgi:hypothetical protein
MTYKKYYLMLSVAMVIADGCNKNKLNEPGLGLLDQTAIANKNGVEGLLIGAYSLLDGESGSNINEGSAASNWIYGSICGSEAYKGGSATSDDQQDISLLELFDANPYSANLGEKWTAVYDGIARANDVLRIMRIATDMNQADTIEVSAEARFLRAFYHFEAKKIWNRIPFIDETVTVEAGNYHVPNDTSWSRIENDLVYAMDNLPNGLQSAPGRVNKYAAEAFLAKVFMFEHKYLQALPLLQEIVAVGQTSAGAKYSLLKNYHDNFDPKSKNGPESVFAAQMSVNDGGTSSGDGSNGNLGDFLNFPVNIPHGYGYFQPSQYLVNHFKTDPVTGLPDLDHFNDVNVTSDEGYASDSAFVPYSGTLDPRLDWTVGRRGIPYLDWGIHAGYDWIRYQPYGGPYSPIKNVVSQSENGTYTDNAWGNAELTANNVNLIRFADVLLWDAEAQVAVGTIDSARYFVNLVREREMDSTTWVCTYIDPSTPMEGFTNTPAANYKIGLYPSAWTDPVFALKAVQFERMLELGMEGHRFFDLVRWGIAYPAITAYLQKEQTIRQYLGGATFVAGKNEYFPIPYSQIELSAGPNGMPSMSQNPGY